MSDRDSCNALADRFRSFSSRDRLDEDLAADVARILRSALEQRGKASLVLSGGSTPKGFFGTLAKEDLDWSRVTVTLADDRWVRADHRDSNDRLVRENLLQGAAGDAQFVSLVTQDEHPRDAVSEISKRLADLGTIDVMILGMGGDGHFASLFPGAENLSAGLDLSSSDTVIAVDPITAPHARMSMTLARILDSRHLIVHIVGEEKRAVLERARLEKDAATLPIAAVLASEAPAATVYWAP
ncbi:6-phosphogluconolactonase [Congregibacter litoralis]|uniref:6-phosphogluconolactonase n=1 Tax=Congregibacter litoralis KT71 TaxID=314285 RepID=A4AD80_9GAMM|nr:6-phosphogluconolactonase [Congregibacter litoralis]EAQ96004.2 6-phosphogluconolactonase [Congregibacter litoralis KT71]